MEIQKIWAEIELKLNEIAKPVYDDLNKSASQEDFKLLQSIIKKDLPTDFIQLYRIHNGQMLETGGGLINGEQLLPIDIIIEELNIWHELLKANTFAEMEAKADEQIVNVWWSEYWIPITSDGSGNHYCIDLNPNFKGTFGQIIRVWHDAPERKIVAKSITEWFEKFLEDINAGMYQYNEDAFGFIKQ